MNSPPQNASPILLAGINVLEVSTRASGAYCGRLLSDLGASVIRVDLPLTVDCSDEVLSDLVISLHRGKVAVGTDGPALERAARAADILVVDSRHDDALDGHAVTVSQRMLDAVSADCAVIDVAGHRRADLTPGGSESVPAAPITESAMAAMSWSLGHRGEAPLTLPRDTPEYLAGTEAAGAAVLAALVQTIAPGTPQQWDVTVTDVLAYYVGQICANFIPYERPWHRDGARASMSGGSYPAAMFECLDGHVSIMCRTPREWAGLVSAMGDPAWSQEERFHDARTVARFHADEADKHLQAWVGAHSRAEVFELGHAHGFPVAPVNSIREMLDMDHFALRGLFDEVEGIKVPGTPWRLQEGPVGDVPATSDSIRDWPAAGTSTSAPLQGLRVLDMSWVWSGPMVTAALRDLGAEVIKIEHRGHADPARLRGPALHDGVPVDGPALEVTPYFNQMNHGKRSVAVDITTDAGRELILDLAAQCDVVVENMRPGAMARRGLAYEKLAKRNPSLVMLSMSIMGQTGPMRGTGGYAPVMSGLAGIDSVMGYSSEDLIGLFNPALGDPNGAGHSLAALLAGLVHQRRTGRGTWIDLAQVEAMIGIQRAPIVEAQRHGQAEVMGNSHSRWWPHGTWRADGDDAWVAVAVRTATERARLAALIGVAEVPDRSTMEAAVEQWVRSRPAHKAVREIAGIGIPVSKVLSFEELMGSAPASRREYSTPVDHPYLGVQSIFTVPWRVNGHGFAATSAAPLLGSDTDEVLGSILGLTTDELTSLRAERAIE
jgi:crotonobetainyl-CoA:carnitine CoA-transferase CaiB-like acyl-CoA transferase